MKWLRQVREWLRDFPLTRRHVTVRGDVVSMGGTLSVGPGVDLTVIGNIVMRDSVQITAGPDARCVDFDGLEL